MKSGFTLLELLVVITIGAVVAASVVSGIFTLQNITQLDRTIRNIKLDIQSTQNQARNSFITYNRNDPNGANANLFTPGSISYINVGWFISFSNQDTNGEVIVTREALFFRPVTNYDISLLRTDIQNFHQAIRGTGVTSFGCNASGLFLIGIRDHQIQNNPNMQIRCASSEGLTNSDLFRTTYPGVEVLFDTTSFGTNAMHSCINSTTNGFFFTAGYGEPALNKDSAGTIRDCQVLIRIRGFGGDITALRVSNETGNIELCGRLCTR